MKMMVPDGAGLKQEAAMKRLIAILAVITALSSCGQEYKSTVTNNSACIISAEITDGTTRSLDSGQSDEIDKWERVRSFTAEPKRASMRMSGDDYEFYDTPAIELVIYNTLDVKVTLYHFESIGNPPEDPILPIDADSKDESYEIYSTSPKLSASRSQMVGGGDTIEVPVNVKYELQDNKMIVTIYK
jgi:hypothetical protein